MGDVGSGKRDFNGLGDCLAKTVKKGGPLALYNGFGVSVMGIIPYRGVYFGLYDTARSQNPYKNDRGVVGIASKFAIAQSVAIAAGYASRGSPRSPCPSGPTRVPSTALARS